MILKKKAVSALFVLVLLIVVAVGIITLILNWSTVFTQKNLSTINSFNEDISLEGYLYSKIKEDSLIIKNQHNKKDLSIQGYKILYNSNEENLDTGLIYFDTHKDLDHKQIININLNCIPAKNFKIGLYTNENTYITIPVNGATSYDITKCRLKKEDCPSGYVYVPGNEDYLTDSGFCVMKYEAKVDSDNDGSGEESCSFDIQSNGDVRKIYSPNFSSSCNIDNTNNKIVSSAEGYPLGDISLFEARRYCKQLGSSYHLINNNEWMTIARNLEQVADNWTGGSIGSGRLKTGNCCPDVGRDCPYPGSYLQEDSIIIDYGLDRNENAKLVLSNNEQIWDFSGNMGEWVDFILLEPCLNEDCDNFYFQDSSGVTMQSPEGEDLSSNFSEIIDPGILGYDGITPSNINWSSYQGMGKIYISEGYSNQSYSAKSARHALIRGGFWNDYYSSGIYALNTKYAPEYHNPTTAIGFRCVYNPL